jgi:alpha-galactosidase
MDSVTSSARLRAGGRAVRAVRALTVLGLTAAAMLAAFAGPADATTAQAAAVSPVAATAQAAATPPLGYNTWYEYHAGNEAVVLAQARALVSTGLAKAGYVYVNLDDGWLAAKRTPDGALTWNPALFPHGLPWLAGQLHAMGLKFGIYEAIGNQTCERYPGSWAHYAQDADTFAQWGVDFVKVDECGGLPTWMTPAKLTQEFQQYGADLRAANPHVVYSQELPIYTMPRTPGALPADFLSTVRSSSQSANMWRVAADENPGRPAAYTIFGHLDADAHLYGFAGAGHWNDLDMLIPGVQKFHWNFTAEQSQIAVWAEEASPLLISTNVATLTQAELSALENPVMINIDRSGQASGGFMSGKVEVVVKNYAGGGKAVLLANRGTGTATGTIPVSQVGIKGAASVSDVWTGKTQLTSGVGYALAPGQTALLVVSPAV